MIVETPPADSPLLSPRRFCLLALELLAVTVLLGCLLVYALTRREPAVWPPSRNSSEWVLQGTQALLIVLGAVTAMMIARAIRGRHQIAVMALAAVAIMYGAAGVGLETLKSAMRATPPTVTAPWPTRQRQTSAMTALPGAADQNEQAPSFDPIAGKRAYTVSCAGCHGASAEGLAGVAPSLLTNARFAESSDQAVAQVIIQGIAANDPMNQSGKVMPARGGNPFLSDADVMNIVAFLRGQLHRASPAQGSAPGVAPRTDTPDAEASADPLDSLPRWVVPAPPRPMHQWTESLPATPASGRTAEGAPLLQLSFGSLLGIHLLIGIGLTAALLWTAFERSLDKASVSLARFTGAYWLAALLIWFVQVLPLFV